MLSCKETSRQLAEAGEERPSLGRRIALRLHLLMCRICRHNVRQLKALDDVARGFARQVESEDAIDTAEALPDDARERIRASLRDASS